jgi:hypothetical protein
MDVQIGLGVLDTHDQRGSAPRDCPALGRDKRWIVRRGVKQTKVMRPDAIIASGKLFGCV